MTAPVILFPDPQLATRDLLRVLLAERVNTSHISTRDAPTDDNEAPRPWVRVRSGSPQRYARVSAVANVRITVYAADEGEAIALASLIEALLLAEATSEDLKGFGPVSGPVSSTDPDTGEPFALVTVAARLRPRQL